MTGKRPPPAPDPPHGEGDDDGADDLARALGDVQPLAGRVRVPARAGAPPRAPSARPPTTVPQVVADDEHIEGRAPGLSPRVLRRLRRGEPAPEAELDLHGLHRDEAERAVERFVRQSVDAGRRVVRIVHGRGLHSEAGAVLREGLAGWLGSGSLSALVLAFVPAPPHAGGSGAALVLLRRRQSRAV